MAKLGKALISIVQVKDGEPKPMYFQWSKSETIFAPKDTNLWFKGSSLIFFGGKAIGNIPYQSDWISDWSKVAKAKTDKYRFLWCKLTEDSEPFLFTGYSGLGTGFLLTADRSTYIINKRLGSSMATTVTLTLSEGMYSPDSLVWTLNDSEISPTKVSETESVYDSHPVYGDLLAGCHQGRSVLWRSGHRQCIGDSHAHSEGRDIVLFLHR